ncbi:MAG: hypothetical protein IJ805_02105 [Lachnospiraceae bacterium]|nr:hypothetical protein [Lachnospiraceae bacterium]
MEENSNIQENTGSRKIKVNSFLLCVIIIMLSPALVAAPVSLLTVHSATGILRSIVTLIILSGVVSVTLYRGVKSRELLFDNRENLTRFVIAYVICSIIAAFSALLPEFTVPVAVFALIGAFLSNTYCGMASGLVFCAIPFLINEKSFEYFLFETVLALFLIILVLVGRNEKKKSAEPVIVYSLVYITLYTALIVLKRADIVPSVIINPMVGLFLSDILIFLTIRAVAKNIIFAYEEKYKDIVDPEYPLLIELKKNNKYEYKRAIHTAYICDRLSDRLGFDRTLMKGAGFYHRIGVLENAGENVALSTVRFLRHENFPEPLIRLLNDYGNEALQEISAEASLICIADSVINEILVRMDKGEDDINYERLIDSQINKLIGSKNGRLQKSDLKIQHLYKIRKYLKEEKLYYDFLR